MAVIKRWYKLLELFSKQRIITMEELKNSTNLSTQTLKNSITLLNEQISGIAQIEQEGSHYSLSIADNKAFELVLEGKLKEDSDFNSSDKRIAYIIKRLFFSDVHILIDDLSEELEVSRGTVNKDLHMVKKLAGEFNIMIEGTPNKGIRIKGGELEQRLLFIYFSYDYFPLKELAQNVLYQLEECANYFHLDKRTGFLLKKAAAVTLHRIRTNHGLREPIPHYSNVQKNSDEAEHLLCQIELDYKITMGRNDEDFLLFPININNISHVENKNKDLENIFNLMMHQIHQTLIVELDDVQIYQEIRNHLLFMINRIIFRFYPNELFYDEIKENYPFAYELASTGAKELQRLLECSISKAEISYLAIYFELALRQHQKDFSVKKIAVVCPSGKGTAALIRRQLKKVIGPEIEIEQYTERMYEQQHLEDTFAVFSTVPLKKVNPAVPVIQMKHLFDDDWLLNVWSRTKKEHRQNFNFVDAYYQKLDSSISYQENLSGLLEKIAEDSIAGEQFVQRVLAREKERSTIFDYGVAFPHAILPDSNRILICLGTFNKPVSTADGEIEIVILVGIPEQLNKKSESELLELYNEIFRFASEKKSRRRILSIEDTNEFRNIIQRKELFL